MAPRLKVFTWSDGFHAFTVATSSRPKALAAWGVSQDLFATGLASELSGGADYEAAITTPGEVVQRGLAIDTGKLGKAARPKKPAGPSKAKRERIERAEQALDKEEVDHQAALDDLADRRAALDDELAQQQSGHEARRKKLAASLKKAKA